MAQDGREGGYIKLHRKVGSSALWLSLTAEQRAVMIEILFLANWKPARARWRDQWYEVGRGELSHSLATISEEARVSVKVVRSTLLALMADDREAGGNGPFLVEKYPISGTGPGTGPRVLSIVNYAKYQDVPDESGTGPGTGRARVGHGSGTGGAQREEGEEGKKGKKEALRRPAPVLLQAQCPSLASLLASAGDAGLDVDPGRLTPQWDEAEALTRAHGADAALACWQACAARRSSSGPMPLAYALPAMRDLGRVVSKPKATAPADHFTETKRILP